MLELKIRISANRLTFELELNDRHRLLHLPHGERVTYPLAVAGKAGRLIVRPHRSHQFLQRRHGDAIAHLELEEPLVTQRNSQDGGNTGLLAKGGTHPGNVMISPGNRDAGLTHDIVNGLVDSRTTVAEIPGDDQFGKKQVANDTSHQPQKGQLLLMLDELVEHRIDIVIRAFQVGAEEELAEQRLVVGREGTLDRHHAVVPGKLPQQLDFQPDLAPQKLAPRRHVGQSIPNVLVGFARIVDDIEKIELFAGGEAFAKRVFDQGTQAARSIFDHVNQLLELAVNIADHVNGFLWKGESGTKICNGGESGVRVRILDAECPQVGERLLIRGKMVGGRLVTHRQNFQSEADDPGFPDDPNS